MFCTCGGRFWFEVGVGFGEGMGGFEGGGGGGRGGGGEERRGIEEGSEVVHMLRLGWRLRC